MNLLCDKCKKEFKASKEQESFISISREKGMKFIMIKCPNCSMSYPYNPMMLDTLKVKEVPVGDRLRCPKETCSGIISYINDNPPFWGCGECGNVWFKKEDLYGDIRKIISKYPYRKHVYSMVNGDYLPVPDKEIPTSYDEKVRAEWDKQ